MWQIGDRIGDYDVLAQLRAGGMATLFLGRRHGAAGFSRYVAIKVVHPHLASDDSFVRMFVDEAKLSARIVHPNVVHIEELGEAQGTYFLVMEFVDGVSLAQFLTALAQRQRRVVPALATHIAMRVAEGLHAAHETRGDDGEPLGVVHRDVSPQNVLVAWQGHVKLIDFGIAKARGRAQHTVEGSLRGKLRYMAPEQALGRAVDRRTDVYALGILLWEMLTQQRLFDDENEMRLLDRVRSPKIAAPSTLVDGIAPALDAVVMSALSVDPDSRPATAHELRRKLADAVPDALAIDTIDVATLVTEVLGSERARGLEALPREVASELATSIELAESTDPVVDAATPATPKRRAGALETLTLDVEQAASPLANPAPSVPLASALPTQVLPVSAPPESRPATPLAVAAIVPGRARTVLPWLAAVAGVFAVLVAVAAVVALAISVDDAPATTSGQVTPAVATPVGVAGPPEPRVAPPAPPVTPLPALPPPRRITFADDDAFDAGHVANRPAPPSHRLGKRPAEKQLWIPDLGR